MTYFRVCITYREPTFEQRYATGPRRFHGVFVVCAKNALMAEARARDAFNEIAKKSQVSWARVILDVRVEEVPGRLEEQLDGAAA